MTTVTGILRDAQQNAIPNAGVTVRYTRALVGFDGGAVAQNDRLFTTDGSGELTMTDLIPGHYDVFVSMPVNANTSQAVIRRGTMSVLDDGPMSLEDALDSNITVTPSVLLQAQAAAAAAETSKQNAGGFAAAASGSASAAGTSSANALSSAVASGAQIYPSAAAGIAAVSVGDIFYVPLSPSGGLDIRQKTGASASTSIGQFLPPTQSPTDSTPGRITKVGDYGWGLIEQAPTHIEDFGGMDSLTTPNGIYRFSSVTSGSLPPGTGSTFSTVDVVWSSSNVISQVARVTMSPVAIEVFVRRYIAGLGQWSDWKRVYSSHNILGTVSQSGGIPTGAIIQRGSNANGGFVRHADGTQICTGTVSTSTSENTQWTYPAEFSEPPRVSPNVNTGVGGAARFANTAGVGPTAAQINAWNTSGNRVAFGTQLTAIGRWF